MDADRTEPWRNHVNASLSLPFSHVCSLGSSDIEAIHPRDFKTLRPGTGKGHLES